jgi:signal transduction histidine kinase/ligand-binding sensor domain-containing protein
MNRSYLIGPGRFLFLLAFIIFACNSDSTKEFAVSYSSFDSISKPVSKKAGKFKIVYLDSVPPPQVVKLSQKPAPIRTPAGFHLSMENFNTTQGLALSSIIYGYKDNSGNLWFGTAGNGVSRYDGKSFTNFSSAHGLIHNLIQGIMEDSFGNIWFTTYGGISKYNGVSFENFTTEQGLSGNDVSIVLEDSNGYIWSASDKGIDRYDPTDKNLSDSKFINYYGVNEAKNEHFISIMEDSQGFIWFGKNNGLIRYNPSLGEKSLAFTDFSDSLGLSNKFIAQIVEDREGKIWFATDELVCKYDPYGEGTSGKTLQYFTTAEGLIDNDVNCITEDRNGNMWFGTRNGVSKLNKSNDSFVNFTIAQGLADNEIKSITEDSSGSLWFGTYGAGLSKFNGESVIEFTPKQGLVGKLVYATLGDEKGNLWLAPANNGIAYYEHRDPRQAGNTFTHYTTAQGMPFEGVLAFTLDNRNDLWIGGDGISKFNGSDFTTYLIAQGLTDDYVTELYTDREGNVWVGTYRNGISKFNGKSFTNLTVKEGLVHQTIWSITEDRSGVIWIATRGGLSRFDGESFMNFKKEQGLPDNKLSSVLEDKNGNIIIGSWGGGVSVIRKDIADKLAKPETLKKGETIFENFSTAEGLSNDVVYALAEDHDGNIFIGTNVGLTVLKGGVGETKNQIAQDGVENYNEKTGFPIKDVSNNTSMYCDDQGIVWVGTGDKFVRFDYSAVSRNTKAPKVYIQNIRINNELVSWRSLHPKEVRTKNNIPTYIADELLVFGRKLTNTERDTLSNKFKNIHFDSIRPFYNIPERLTLPYSKNNISFDFIGIETNKPHLVNYQFKLDGYDKDWAPVSHKSTASFGNISEGNYTFLVKAQSPDGIWSEPLTYNFQILPPWYRSWIANLFYVLLFLCGLYLIDRYQRKRVLLKEREKMMRIELAHAKEIEKAFTDLKQTQAQLVQAEKMASLGELTAGVAHEIQNPLNFVNNFSEVSNELLIEMNEELIKGDIEEARSIANDLKVNLEKINHHGKRADAIVKGMLMHSRVSSGEKEPTDINSLADEYLRLAYHGLRAKDKSFNSGMETNFAENIGLVNIIPQDIGRVILNLITNAFYAVDDKKKKHSENYDPLVSVSTKKSGNKVYVSVKDNGNGIPKTVIDKIFQPFFTTKPSGQGTGLGLSLSYDIVRAHGGELKVDTTENIGTTFTVIIPIQ